jgi:hypothetical protein
MSQHLSSHGMQYVLDIVGHKMKTIVMQHCDTLYKHTKCFCSNSVHWGWYQGPWTAALVVQWHQRKQSDFYMWRGQMFLMHAYSFSYGLKMVALCLIAHHSPVQKSIILCLVALLLCPDRGQWLYSPPIGHPWISFNLCSGKHACIRDPQKLDYSKQQ